jgi:hypothetical protein
MTKLFGLSDRNMNRVLLGLVVVLALVGGYFHAQLQTLRRRYDFLVNKYDKLEQSTQNESRR